MSSDQHNLKSLRPRREFVPFFVLLLGLLFTLIGSYYVFETAEAEDQARFEGSVQEINATIYGRMQTYLALLRAGTGLFAASDSVTRGEFANFADKLDLSQQYPGIQGIGYSIRIQPGERDALVASMKAAGVPDFKIWPNNERAEYHSIIFLEPLDNRNKAALGYDMFTESVRRAAMERARDSGRPAASSRVVLVQEIDPEHRQPGFLVYVPVYKNRASIITEADRRRALQGFVYAPFRAGDLLGAILTNQDSGIAVQVFDGAEARPESMIYDSGPLGTPLPSGYRPRFTSTARLEIAGQPWLINLATRPDFDVGSRKTALPYTVSFGFVISLILFGVTRSLAQAKAVAESSLVELQQSNAMVTKTLVDRERAEQALRESEERYRELFENANDIVYTHDFDGNLTSINKAGEAITGYTVKELLSSNLSQLLPEDSVEASRQMLTRKLSGEQRTNYEIDFRSKTGSLITLEVSSRLVTKDGAPIGVQGIARDITARRQAEEALRQADQRALSEYERLLERVSTLAQAFGTSRDLVSIFRALRDFAMASAPCDGLFVSLYDPVRNVRTAAYGWGDSEEVDTSALPPMPVTASGPNSRAVMTGEVVITNDYMGATRGHPGVIIGPDNGLRPQSSLAAPMAVMGRIIGTIEIQSYEAHAYKEGHVTAMRMAANLTAVAIENVRLLERESSARAVAEESNRLKDEFLATVSHELRTPLTAILGWSRMLETGSLEAAAAARAIETIRRNAKTQSQIIDDILDVSRIITGNLYLDLNPIEMAPVLEGAVNVVRPTAEAKGINIEMQLEPQPAVVSGDANRLQQVFWNLVSNAVKFTPKGGQVLIALSQSESQVEIKVSDTGQGINSDFLPFVFDRFRQADSTTTRQHGGLGLGLAIARHLVEIHGGVIRAESKGRDQGATFIVQFPLLGAASKLTQSAKEPAFEVALETLSSVAGLHVLLVDDDPDTLELLTAVLAQRKARVTAVTSAADAVAAIRACAPDVLISDIAMPGEDGYGLIRQVKAMTEADGFSLPAIAITAYAKDEDRERALAQGFQYYVSKPVELSEFITAVATAAGRARNGSQAAPQSAASSISNEYLEH